MNAKSMVLGLSLLGLFGCAANHEVQPRAESPAPVAEPVRAPVAAPAPARAEVTAHAMPATTLLPRSVLFGNPDHAQLGVSPDGKWLSWLAPDEHHILNVFVAPADAPQSAKQITHDTKRGVRIYRWAYDHQHLLYLQDSAGDENWHVHAVELASLRDRDLTPLEKTRAELMQLSSKHPHQILVGLNDRDPQLSDPYLLDITTGQRTRVLENREWASFVADDDLHVRLGGRMTAEGGMEFFRLDAKTDAATEGPFLRVPSADSLTTQPLGFDASGRTLYLFDSVGRDTAALVSIDIATGAQKVLAENPKADVADWLQHPRTLKPQAAAFDYTRKEWVTVDPAIADDLAYLRGVAHGDLQVLDRSLDDRVWAVLFVMDDGPIRFYRYDRAAKKATFLFTNRAALENAPLARMQPVVIPARDGLALVSYLMLPRGAVVEGAEKPARPLPLVLLVHGGPWARTEWGFNPYDQWLANRGYAVLSVNFRGSTGFGKAFTNAGDREWGRKMHDDLLDAVQWAIDRGITDPRSVAIFGGSYGGYATLVGMTLTPDRFACGVDLFGPSNLATLLASVPPYWKPMMQLFANRVGDPATEAGKKLLAERSPLTRVDQIARPLLIGQGANDVRVKAAESDQIAKAMQQKNLAVTYVVFSDEGHGFARPENTLAFNAISEAFLAGCLGGAQQPIGDDLRGSSAQVQVGADRITGLVEAVRQGSASPGQGAAPP